MTKNVTTKFLSLVIAMSATTVSFASIANAQTVDFAYSPIELTDAESAADLEERIKKFARQTCQSSNPLVTPTMRRECREDVAQQLREQIWGA